MGKCISKGIAIGELMIIKKRSSIEEMVHIQDVEEEQRIVKRAIELAKEQLEALYQKEFEKDQVLATILKAQKSILTDEEFIHKIIEKIRNEKISAICAIQVTSGEFIQMLQQTNDHVIMARSSDISEVARQLVLAIEGTPKEGLLPEVLSVENHTEAKIMYCEEFYANDLIDFDVQSIVGLICKKHSPDSHFGILARAKKIPVISCINEQDIRIYDQQMIAMDAEAGDVFLDCDKLLLEALKERKKNTVASKRQKRDDRIAYYANLATIEEMDEFLEKDIDGIGLFRSEFLFMGKEALPTIDEQFHIYKTILEKSNGKPVVIRTIDIGSDKPVKSIFLEAEKNPALGLRGIRFCKKFRAVFEEQLYALCKASPYGNLSVLFPMITSLEDIAFIKEELALVKEQLKNDNIPSSEMVIGVMIETPAAVILSEKIAKEVDFLSIGTNDLVQYTFAIDRENDLTQESVYCDPSVIMKMIKEVARSAKKYDISVSICGELASKTDYLEDYISYGINMLSLPLGEF